MLRMLKDEAKLKIQELVEKYEKVRDSRSISKYTEEETKKDFIQPLFHALGWDTQNKNEVTAEEHHQTGRPDYGFYLDGRCKFFLEAKSLKTDLHNEEFANQAVRYSWNKGVTWAVLTDFESLKVFNAQVIDKSLFDKLFFEIKYTEYVDRFDQLWLLSKESFEAKLLDSEGEKFGKKLQRVSVTELLYKDLSECRKILTNALGQWNGEVDKDLLDEGVQKLLDRLIFLRVAEDRGIEPQTLIPLIRDWEESGSKKHLYESMIEKFRELDKIYNSGLFLEHPFEKWEEYSGATEKVIKILYGKPSYYEYDFKAMPVDVLGGVYENYLGYRLAKSKKGLSIDKDASKRKEQGIYYTPDFIVDYIVKNTLKPVLDKCKSIEDLKKVKVLDPACGSGSFLLKALEVIHDKYLEFGSRGGTFTKIDILLNNIYGVDLDNQAVEIARLNLLISALDVRMKLPSLDKNIKNGNSLISGTDEELKKYFGKNYKDKKSFNWQEEFPEVFRQGGFDVIIGNPPYVRVQTLDKVDSLYFSNNYVSAKGGYDLYILFIERFLKILNTSGYFGMILPNKFLNNKYGEGIRKLLSDERVLNKLVDFGDYQIFTEVTTYTALLFLQKVKSDKFMYAGQIDLGRSKDFKPSILLNAKFHQLDYRSLGQSEWVLGGNITTSLMNKIKTNHPKLEDLTYRIFQGLKTGCDPVYILKFISSDNKYIKVKNKEGNEYLLEDHLFHFIVKGTEMRSFRMLKTNKVILFPYDEKGNLIKSEELKLKYPKIFNYLIDKQKLLENRESGKFSGEFFYQYSRNQALNVITNKKIITPDIAPQSRFILDETGEYFFTGGVSGGYGILAKNDIDNYVLTALLNSKLLDWYLKNISSKFRGNFFSYESRFIKQLPIAIKGSKEISNLSKKIINLYKYQVKMIENSEKWLSAKSEIEKIDKKIDQEVYKLYGLDQEEINIIENNNV